MPSFHITYVLMKTHHQQFLGFQMKKLVFWHFNYGLSLKVNDDAKLIDCWWLGPVGWQCMYWLCMDMKKLSHWLVIVLFFMPQLWNKGIKVDYPPKKVNEPYCIPYRLNNNIRRTINDGNKYWLILWFAISPVNTLVKIIHTFYDF